jgi:hypothetical protein
MKTVKAIIVGMVCQTAGAANAQWVVSDPGNLAQGIINTTKQIVETSATAQHTLDGFKETAKIFEQGRKYYDALKAVHDVVKGGVKVKKSIDLVADISEIYVRNYQKMLGDPNYTPDELSTISFGYAKLLSESADILQDLKNVVNVTGMSLSDAERLAIIDQSYKRLLEYRNLVQYYTNKNIYPSHDGMLLRHTDLIHIFVRCCAGFRGKIDTSFAPTHTDGFYIGSSFILFLFIGC